MIKTIIRIHKYLFEGHSQIYKKLFLIQRIYPNSCVRMIYGKHLHLLVFEAIERIERVLSDSTFSLPSHESAVDSYDSQRLA